MCSPKVPKQQAPQTLITPAPQPVATELAIDPAKTMPGVKNARKGKSSLVIQRAVGGIPSGSGLQIGGGG